MESGSDGQPDTRLREQLRAKLASDPGDGSAVGPALNDLCLVAGDELEQLGVAVTLMTPAGAQALAGCSGESGRRLEEVTFSVGEGPGCDAFAFGRPVLVADLEAALVRWPGFVPEASRAGVGAVYAFPLQLGAAKLGVLTFYSREAQRLTETQLLRCLVFAELATEILLSNSTHSNSTSEELVDALRFRNEVYQAQGMVMVQLGVSLVEALARMRAHAYATGIDLTALSLGILAGAIKLESDGIG